MDFAQQIKFTVVHLPHTTQKNVKNCAMLVKVVNGMQHQRKQIVVLAY